MASNHTHTTVFLQEVALRSLSGTSHRMVLNHLVVPVLSEALQQRYLSPTLTTVRRRDACIRH